VGGLFVARVSGKITLLFSNGYARLARYGRHHCTNGAMSGQCKPSNLVGGCLSPLHLHVTNQPPLRPGIAVDVALCRLDGAMAGE
jgi:hypothetical protein